MSATLSPVRIGRITASRVPAILGLSPYQSRADVLREMVREAKGAESEFGGNRFTAFGNEHEAEAVELYEFKHGVTVLEAGDRQVTHVHPKLDWLAATPDGRTARKGLEVKCPPRGAYTSYLERPDYEMQLDAQGEVLHALFGIQAIDFVVWRESQITVTTRERNPEWIDSVHDELTAFLKEYRETVADPLLAGEHLIPRVDVRTDDEWLQAEFEYADLKAQLDFLQYRMDGLRERFIGLSPDSSARGRSVHLVRSEKKGAVAYAKALKTLAPNADLAPYRGEPSVVYSIRTAKEAKQ